MNDFKSDGITQAIIAMMVGSSISKVSRFFSERGMKPIGEKGPQAMRYSIKDIRLISRNLFKDHGPILQKKHAFYNFKGGTGKTSICFQVASHIALMGYNVLVVDADPQAHLSTSMGVFNDNGLTLYDIIVGQIMPEKIIKNIFDGLDCIPSNLSLTRLETEFTSDYGFDKIKNSLQSIDQNYDFIFFDTNPTISLLNRNIIYYMDIIDIICETHPYSLNGLKLLMNDLEFFLSSINIEKIFNIVPNKYEDRSGNAAEAMSALRSYYLKDLKEDFAIRKSEDIITSSKIGKPVSFFAKKNSNAIADIIDLVHHIIMLSR